MLQTNLTDKRALGGLLGTAILGVIGLAVGLTVIGIIIGGIVGALLGSYAGKRIKENVMKKKKLLNVNIFIVKFAALVQHLLDFQVDEVSVEDVRRLMSVLFCESKLLIMHSSKLKRSDRKQVRQIMLRLTRCLRKPKYLYAMRELYWVVKYWISLHADASNAASQRLADQSQTDIARICFTILRPLSKLLVTNSKNLDSTQQKFEGKVNELLMSVAIIELKERLPQLQLGQQEAEDEFLRNIYKEVELGQLKAIIEDEVAREILQEDEAREKQQQQQNAMQLKSSLDVTHNHENLLHQTNNNNQEAAAAAAVASGPNVSVQFDMAEFRFQTNNNATATVSAVDEERSNSCKLVAGDFQHSPIQPQQSMPKIKQQLHSGQQQNAVQTSSSKSRLIDLIQIASAQKQKIQKGGSSYEDDVEIEQFRLDKVLTYDALFPSVGGGTRKAVLEQSSRIPTTDHSKKLLHIANEGYILQKFLSNNPIENEGGGSTIASFSKATVPRIVSRINVSESSIMDPANYITYEGGAVTGIQTSAHPVYSTNFKASQSRNLKSSGFHWNVSVTEEKLDLIKNLKYDSEVLNKQQVEYLKSRSELVLHKQLSGGFIVGNDSINFNSYGGGGGSPKKIQKSFVRNKHPDEFIKMHSSHSIVSEKGDDKKAGHGIDVADIEVVVVGNTTDRPDRKVSLCESLGDFDDQPPQQVEEIKEASACDQPAQRQSIKLICTESPSSVADVSLSPSKQLRKSWANVRSLEKAKVEQNAANGSVDSETAAKLARLRELDDEDPDKMWEKVIKKENIKIYKRQIEGNPSVMVRAEADVEGCSQNEIFEQIYYEKNRTKWDKVTLGFAVIDQLGAGQDVIYFYVDPGFGVTKRDFLQKRAVARDFPNAGDLTIIFFSIAHPAYPEKKGTIRAISHIAAYILRKHPTNPNNTMLTIISQSDIKGKIPKYIVNFLSARAPAKWIESMRKGVIDHRKNKNK